MKLFISAGETSADIHGAELLKAIRKLRPNLSIRAFGMGGPKLEEAGLQLSYDARNLLVMGFTEILGKIPNFIRALNQLTEAVKNESPDIAVLIDYPDFHFLLARRLKSLGVRMVYYIPPKVWAWRKRRIHFLKRTFSQILCILPFEEKFYQKHQVNVKYVGNPLVDELPWDLSKDEARKKLGIKISDRVLLGMPGSRSSELQHHFELVLDASVKIVQAFESEKKKNNWILLIPVPETVQLEPLQKHLEAWKNQKARVKEVPLEIQLRKNQASLCIISSDAGMVKSGTSTLEAGLLRLPHVLFFKPGKISAWIFRHLVRYRGPVGLVNLIADREKSEDFLIPEILCEAVTPSRLANEVIRLLKEDFVRRKMMTDLDQLRKQVAGVSHRFKPSQDAARAILEECAP